MEDAITVGSDESCDVPMAFTGVSSRHCRILFDDGEIWVEDLDSTNGTYVDGRRVEPGHHQRLDRSSELSLGGEATLTCDDHPAARRKPLAGTPDLASELEAVNSMVPGSDSDLTMGPSCRLGMLPTI